MFSVSIAEKTGIASLAPVGELDIYTAGDFETELARAEARSPKLLVFDLRRLKFVDSTGLRSLLGAARRAREAGRQIAVVRGPREVQSVFRICGVEQFFQMVDDPEELVALV